VIYFSYKEGSLNAKVDFVNELLSDTFEIFSHSGHHHLNRGAVIPHKFVESSKLNQIHIWVGMHLPTLLRPAQSEPTASTILS
jgi:hypothetical protein